MADGTFDSELEAARTYWRYQPPDDLLAGRTLLVTGAGAGIGAAAARTFARFGANVVLLGRTREKLETVFDDIADTTDTDPTIVPCDLAALDGGAFDDLSQQIAAHYGHLDGVVHCAGVLGPRVPLAHYGAADWHNVLQINLTVPFLLTRAMLPVLEQARDASVVFVSSSVGLHARAYWGAYAVSKFGVEGLSQVFADEHATLSRIRFNTVNPGATRTAMRAAAYPAEDPATVSTPSERMDLFLYLAGPESRTVTGQQLDGREWSPLTTSRGV